MTSRSILDLDARLREIWLKSEAEFRQLKKDLKPFITCTYRSNEEQDKLYAQGRITKGEIVTYARAGQSKHNSFPALAFDIAFLDNKQKLNWDKENFVLFAEIAKRHGAKWGGDFKTFKDNPHFEL